MGPLIPVTLEQELVPFSVFSPVKDHVPALGQLTIARTGICRANEAESYSVAGKGSSRLLH